MAEPLKLTQSPTLSRACELVVSRTRDKRDEWHEAAKKAAKGGKATPSRDTYPRAGSPRWVRWAATLLRTEFGDLERWHRNADVVKCYADLAGDLLGRLKTLPEFKHLDLGDVELRWSTSAMVRKDGPLEDVTVGKARALSVADRLTWPAPGTAPLFRVDLSLPVFLLAEEDELEAPMHALLMQLGGQGGTPYLRKPDIAAFAATLGRYGARTAREVQAVAHAAAHPDAAARYVRHHVDPHTGQGLLWAPRAVAGELDGWN